MSKEDVWKVVAMLTFAVAVVALLCYARVDLGLTQAQANERLSQWIGTASRWSIVIWSQILVATLAGLAYRAWRHRAENGRACSFGRK